MKLPPIRSLGSSCSSGELQSSGQLQPACVCSCSCEGLELEVWKGDLGTGSSSEPVPEAADGQCEGWSAERALTESVEHPLQAEEGSRGMGGGSGLL